MIMYSMNIYSFPISLLKKIEKTCRNFIWCGDIRKKNLLMVAWNKTCQPYGSGGLGLRSLIRLNEATNLKLGWDMLNSNESWATLLKNRVLRSHGWIN